MPYTRNPGVDSKARLISWLASAGSRGHRPSPSAKVPQGGRADFPRDSHLALTGTSREEGALGGRVLLVRRMVPVSLSPA